MSTDYFLEKMREEGFVVYVENGGKQRKINNRDFLARFKVWQGNLQAVRENRAPDDFCLKCHVSPCMCRE